jgi:hypothetical protein
VLHLESWHYALDLKKKDKVHPKSKIEDVIEVCNS